MKCKFCNSEKIVRKGKRKLVQTENQIYQCKNCRKQFSLKQGKFSDSFILNAVCKYNSGESFVKTAQSMRKDFKKDVSPVTISRWCKEHGASFLRIRSKLLEKYKSIPPISSNSFVHSGIVYPYMLHNWKLNEFCNHEGLKKYLLSLGPWVNKYFSSGIRCSKIQTKAEVKINEKKNLLCKAANFALGACKDIKERHAAVQKHLLHNDSATVATEVPVWMMDTRLGAISGHIDILQIRFGKVWVLDFKSGVKYENKSKVISQLFWYARSLSFRSKIPLSEIRCGYFDSQACLQFEPSKVKLKYDKALEK